MGIQLAAVRGLAWFWGSVALAGGGGALAIQAMGPPDATDLPAPVLTATAPLPTAQPQAAPTPKPPGPTSSIPAHPLANTAMLPPLRIPVPPGLAAGTTRVARAEPGKSRRPESAQSRKVELRTAKRTAPATTATHTERWTQTQTSYWPYATQYAATQYPAEWGERASRYSYVRAPYYGYYSGY